MAQRPSRCALAALLLGATLFLPWLAGSPAGAAQPAPHRATADMSSHAGPLAWLWQTLVDLVHGGVAPGPPAAPRGRMLPDAGCSLTPDGQCTTSAKPDAGCSTTSDGHCTS
jgi:hypothetical protein